MNTPLHEPCFGELTPCSVRTRLLWQLTAKLPALEDKRPHAHTSGADCCEKGNVSAGIGAPNLAGGILALVDDDRLLGLESLGANTCDEHVTRRREPVRTGKSSNHK